jgi:hypothetical protein
MNDSVRPHAGWHGQFTTQQQPGAYPNGSRIRKKSSDPGDTAKAGSTGTVLGSLAHPDVGIGYFVEWDHLPQMAVFIMGRKLAPAGKAAASPVKHWPSDTPLSP